jgi:ribosomal protein L37AE/L43A
MDGVVWLFLVLFGGLVVGVVALGRGRGRSIEKESGRCPSCQTPMSPRRVSNFRSRLFLGQWVCPHCGTRMKRRGGAAGVAS